MLQFRHFGTLPAQLTDPPAVKKGLQDLGLYKDQPNKNAEAKYGEQGQPGFNQAQLASTEQQDCNSK